MCVLPFSAKNEICLSDQKWHGLQTCDFTQALWVRLNCCVIWCFRSAHAGLPGAKDFKEFAEWNTCIMSLRANIGRDFCPSNTVRSKHNKLFRLRTQFQRWKFNILRNVCLSGPAIFRMIKFYYYISKSKLSVELLQDMYIMLKPFRESSESFCFSYIRCPNQKFT